MTTFFSADITEVFGLDWRSMLFYVGNFLLLVGALIVLLYRPVKKILQEKRNRIIEMYEQNEKLKAESEKNQAEFEKQVADMKLENARVAASVAGAAQKKADAIIAEAEEQAKTIIDIAKKDAATQLEQLKGGYRDSVGDLAVQVAQKLLEREISQKDNAALIEEALSDWEDAD